MVQYLKMISVDDPREFSPATRLGRFNTADWFPPEYTPSPLGEMLFGLKDWSDEAASSALEAENTHQ
jgi:hypothetical protein